MKTILALREKASRLPLSPGVYLMKNKEGTVIYVGKSKKLKNRVSSYFLATDHGYKTEKMISHVEDFDYILCDTEMEALALENNLIKQYTPKYNIKLKDAKSYPYLHITSDFFPRVVITRQREAGGDYFGPYSGMADAIAAQDAVQKVFGLPKCKRKFPQEIGKGRPCLYYQMGQCCGVCTGGISRETYMERVRNARKVLSGNVSEAARLLEGEMTALAEAERFEEAMERRNMLFALRKLSDRQKVVADTRQYRDAVALHCGDACNVLSLLRIRAGRLTGKHDFLFAEDACTDPASVLAFLYDYYREQADLPQEILLDFEAEEEDLLSLAQFLSEKKGRRVKLHIPLRGEGKHLCAMARQNAEERAKRQAHESEREQRSLLLLAEALALEVLPERIEAYDISNIGTEYKTASMVVAVHGKMKPSEYRSFRIRSVEGVDDYASMKEALLRRFAHVGKDEGGFSELPDLILLDGGVGHLSVGREALQEAGYELPIFGMVKDEFHKTRTLTDGVREFSIADNKLLYCFVYNMQEEAHRFAVSHTMKAKQKQSRRSSLLQIRGIGEKKAKLLLQEFHSVRRISQLTREELLQVKGITQADASAIVSHFQAMKTEGGV